MDEKIKFFFDSENFNFYINDLYLDNKIKISENSNEDELILLTELSGGIIAFAKNQKIKLYK